MTYQKLSFDASEEQINAQNELMQKLGINNLTKLINVSFTLTEWIVNEVAKGHSIASIDLGDASFSSLKGDIIDGIIKAAGGVPQDNNAKVGSYEKDDGPLSNEQLDTIKEQSGVSQELDDSFERL